MKTVYCARIDALIPVATRYADDVAGPEPLVPEKHTDGIWLSWVDKWNRAYHRQMNVLAHMAGLRVLSHQA